MSRDIERRGYAYCAETCPSVNSIVREFLDSGFDRLVEEIKAASSYKLREALNEACADLIEAEGQVEDLTRQVARKDDEIADLRRVIAELEAEVSA